jgi:hypothetical protein
MLKEHPQPTAEQIARAQAIRANAQRQREAERESFERCDTDGFLSQWAHSIGAQKDDLAAKILEQGGYARFPVLVDQDGEVVADREYRFANRAAPWKTDIVWRVDEVRFGRRWVPAGDRSRVQKALGLREESRWFPAAAAILGGGKGIAGASSCYVGPVRTDR